MSHRRRNISAPDFGMKSVAFIVHDPVSSHDVPMMISPPRFFGAEEYPHSASDIFEFVLNGILGKGWADILIGVHVFVRIPEVKACFF